MDNKNELSSIARVIVSLEELRSLKPEDIKSEYLKIVLCVTDAQGNFQSVSLEELQAENKKLKDAITKVVTQKLDNLCWRDCYIELAGLVGIDFNPDMMPEDQMLENCRVFIKSLKDGCPYKPKY